MPYCECGGWVTDDFVRVFAPEGENTVAGCPDCTTEADIRGGEGL